MKRKFNQMEKWRERRNPSLATGLRFNLDDEFARMGDIENVASAFLDIVEIEAVGAQAGSGDLKGLTLGAGNGKLGFGFGDLGLDDDPVQHALLARQGVIAEIGNRDGQ